MRLFELQRTRISLHVLRWFLSGGGNTSKLGKLWESSLKCEDELWNFWLRKSVYIQFWLKKPTKFPSSDSVWMCTLLWSFDERQFVRQKINKYRNRNIVWYNLWFIASFHMEIVGSIIALSGNKFRCMWNLFGSFFCVDNNSRKKTKPIIWTISSSSTLPLPLPPSYHGEADSAFFALSQTHTHNASNSISICNPNLTAEFRIH